MNLKPSGKTMRNGSCASIEQYKIFDMTTDGTSMTGTVIIEAEITPTIGMIVITPTIIAKEGMTNEESMRLRIDATLTNRDIRTTSAITEDEISKETSVCNWPKITDRSWTETHPMPN